VLSGLGVTFDQFVDLCIMCGCYQQQQHHHHHHHRHHHRYSEPSSSILMAWQVLSGLGVTFDQFVDLCIMCGCDYCGTIRGVGPKSALTLIKKHGTIEKVIEVMQRVSAGPHCVHRFYPPALDSERRFSKEAYCMALHQIAECSNAWYPHVSGGQDEEEQVRHPARLAAQAQGKLRLYPVGGGGAASTMWYC
jgi:hypothetical protein